VTDARRRAEEALAKWDEHDSYFRERGRKYEGMSRACARSLAAALRAVLAEEDERGAVAAEIAGLPVHFVAHLPRGRVFMHPDTPKSGVRDAWPPPMPSMIPVPVAPAPPDATEHPCGCYAPEGDHCHRHPAPPAADEVREAAFARFGRALLPKWWDDGNPGDIDGGDAQEAAEACGLWHHVERHSDDVECEWCGNDGSPCGELTEVGLSALAARGGA